MKFIFFLSTLLYHAASAQFAVDEKTWIAQLNLNADLPEDLRSTRSVVFYSYSLTNEELINIQQSFQLTGIDAVAYFELDKLTAGKDITKAFAGYLLKREITNLLFTEKDDEGYRISVTLFNRNETLITQNQPAWSATNRLLSEALKVLYRTGSGQKKNSNLLINEVPEMDMTINPIVGKRNEFFALDLKVDPLAVPKTGDEIIDRRLEEIFTANYPLKYKLTDAGTSERDLRKQGLPYVVCYVHTRGVVAKEVLGYDMSKSESALVSVAYLDDNVQLKNIPSNTPIYKFYFKHIDSGNVFFGTKWDADLTWEQALVNQIKGMKAELRLK